MRNMNDNNKLKFNSIGIKTSNESVLTRKFNKSVRNQSMINRNEIKKNENFENSNNERKYEEIKDKVQQIINIKSEKKIIQRNKRFKKNNFEKTSNHMKLGLPIIGSRSRSKWILNRVDHALDLNIPCQKVEKPTNIDRVSFALKFIKMKEKK